MSGSYDTSKVAICCPFIFHMNTFLYRNVESDLPTLSDLRILTSIPQNCCLLHYLKGEYCFEELVSAIK